MSAIIYFAIFMAVVYFLIVVPYRAYEARSATRCSARGADRQTCPECLSSDLPVKATRCKYCTAELRRAVGRRWPP